MLHANRNIICASDPYAPIFKAYRNHFATGMIQPFDCESPLHDYYFDKSQNDLFRKMQSESFDIPLRRGFIGDIVPKIIKHSELFSPLLHDCLHLLTGGTFRELFQSGLHVIENAYRKGSAQAIGFKEVWVGEFATHFLGIAKEAKVIHVVRDPRAVVASNFVSGVIYPLLFLTRQWRKQASLAWLGATKSEKIKVIRFEDLISSPEMIARDICEFIGVQFDDKMIDTTNLTDGAGKPWHQNSSYQDSMSVAKRQRQAFNLAAVENWQSVLPEQYVSAIEKLCYFEMKLFRYQFICDNSNHHNLDKELLFEDDDSRFADWIRPYSYYNYVKEMAAENFRHDLMLRRLHLNENVETLLALDPAIYTELVFRN